MSPSRGWDRAQERCSEQNKGISEDGEMAVVASPWRRRQAITQIQWQKCKGAQWPVRLGDQRARVSLSSVKVCPSAAASVHMGDNTTTTLR